MHLVNTFKELLLCAADRLAARAQHRRCGNCLCSIDIIKKFYLDITWISFAKMKWKVYKTLKNLCVFTFADCAICESLSARPSKFAWAVR